MARLKAGYIGLNPAAGRMQAGTLRLGVRTMTFPYAVLGSALSNHDAT